MKSLFYIRISFSVLGSTDAVSPSVSRVGISASGAKNWEKGEELGQDGEEELRTYVAPTMSVLA